MENSLQTLYKKCNFFLLKSKQKFLENFLYSPKTELSK